ncbi:hypothetical protein WJX81_003811 [Elliptochloris bilobata]|uniref:cyclic pyranopterin monophosphate synthase n=1 Tax=Elliptochloris bilobata TaxID=381761 RepID=A0AAW1RKA1_9CHLO
MERNLLLRAARAASSGAHVGGCGASAEERGRASGAAGAAASGLTHVDGDGRAAMVDVGGKAPTERTASASGRVALAPEAFALVAANQIKKGDVLTVAQLAGIMGAKQTAALIPLCHPLPLTSAAVELALDAGSHSVVISAQAKTVGPTGVEMEALTAVAVSALTVYDMCKAVSRDITIGDIRLDQKSGGRSGDYQRGRDYATGS